MNTQVRKRIPDQSAKRRVVAPLTSSTVVGDSHQDADVVRMAGAEVAARNVERHAMIANAAYYRAQRRGFEPGHELEDWLAAEIDIANLLLLTELSPGASVVSGSKP